MIAVEQETGKKYLLQKNGEKERELVRQLSQIALDNNNGCVARAALELGILRTTLAMRVKNWGLTCQRNAG